MTFFYARWRSWLQSVTVPCKLWRWIALPLLLLAALPAQAVDYRFPGSLPIGCVDNSGGNYACGALTLAAGDTFVITSPKPATITFNGAFSTGAGVLINSAGTTADLRLVIYGAFTLGANSTLNAEVQTLGSGAVTIAAGSSVSGGISTETGNVTLGAPASVGGSISTVTGFVVLGAGATVGGSVSTVTGYVSLGASAVVGGAVSTANAGYVVLGASARVGGAITVSGSGYVTTGDSAIVGGSISTVSDAITLGANSQVTGSVSVSQTGAVTLGASASVGGNVTTVTGATTVGAGGTVGGQVSMNGTGAITIGAGGRVHAVCCYQRDASCVTDGSGITPAPLICIASAPTNFECLETGANYNNLVSNTQLRNPLFTKLAGTSFKMDIAALNADGSIESNYAAASNKNVSLELVDGSGGNTCSSSAALAPPVSQTLTFASTDAGRKTATVSVGNAYTSLRCRVTDANQSPPTVSCSTDAFSVRPSAVSLLTSATATSPSASSTPAVKAGANFTLSANTQAGVNYGGSLALDPLKLTAQTAAQDATVQSGGVVGVLSPLLLSTNTAAVGATYNEVGYLYLAPGAYRDDIFTTVDSTTGDCITGTANDNNLSDILIGGQYGCSIGNRTPVSLGRFYPDHFAISAAMLTATCTVNTAFSYFGQDGFTTAFVLTAQSLANGNTQNYTGAFAKLDLTIYQNYGFSAAPLPIGSRLASGTTAPTGNWRNGVASVTAKHQISRPTVPTAETLITISAAPTDGEVTASAATAIGNATKLRYGRLMMKNAYGSELLSLPVPLEAQYWVNAGLNAGYYVTNIDDSCTVIPMTSIKMGNYLQQLNACETQISPSGTVTLNAGKIPGAGLVLTNPGRGNAGSVDLVVNVGATPAGNTCVATTESAASAAHVPWFGANPVSRATFGIYKSPLIYRRENY